ncbi:MAG: hypothetical protein KAS32_07535 [Candidatus Peribacteraceae bacterium]|nr:hypothetical protein [Candidatus Peribacteraceae bacterium]
MRKYIVMAMVLGVLMFAGGCLPASQQEVQTLTGIVNQIVPAVREAVSTSSEETRDRVEVVLGQVEQVNEAVATAESPVEALKAGVAATSPVNPYTVPILAGIGILEALGIIGVNKLRKTNHTALEEVVIGVEDSKKNGGKLKEAFNATESLVTRRKVAKIINGT